MREPSHPGSGANSPNAGGPSGSRRAGEQAPSAPDSPTPPAPSGVHDLFAAQAARTPAALAVMAGQQQITYRDLDRRANALALRLVALGVAPDALVGACLERSIELIIALLAIHKAGGAYVPLDPAYPADRLEAMARDSDLRVIVTQPGLALPGAVAGSAILTVEVDGSSADEPPILRQPLRPANLAYVIYTSGSTGRPKGVMVEHGALMGYLGAIQAAFGLGPGDRLLQFASINFDASIEEIFATLASGATLVLRTDSMLGSAELFLHTCRRWAITVLDIPTSYWHRLAADMTAARLDLPPQIRLVVIGGEEALADRLRLWREHAGATRLLNMYGPTETTIAALMAQLDAPGDAGGGLPIGSPLPGFRVYVLDGQQRPLPPGAVGEIHIGGVGLARGYLGRPAQTAAAFGPDPFAGAQGVPAGARMYRTGDYGRLLPDGALEFRGRNDDQIKLRGYRIESGEIETVLRSHADVRDALVAVRGGTAGSEQRLAAYVIPANLDIAPDSSAGDEIAAEVGGPAAGIGPEPRLRAGSPPGQQPPAQRSELGLGKRLERYLRDRLPAHMVPQDWVMLPAFPLLPNGKLDRRSLPDPASQRPTHAASAREPATSGRMSPAEAAPPTGAGLEERIAALWSEALELPVLPRDAGFVELNGQSLEAMAILARIRQEFEVEISLRTLFTATVATLARLVADARTSAAAAEGARSGQPIEHAVAVDAPLSFAQQRLWFVEQLHPGSAIHNIALAIRFRGRLDRAALERSLNKVVARHEALRTTFALRQGQPVQVIQPALKLALPFEDLSAPAAIAGRIAAETSRPFDLGAGPLLRALLLGTAPEEHTLALAIHHLVFDGASVKLLADELAAFYHAETANAPAEPRALAIQYADFARWQRERPQAELLRRQLAYWTGWLAGAPHLLGLLTDRPRPSEPTLRGGVERITIPAGVAMRLHRFGQRNGFTQFMILLAAFQTLLYRHSDQADILVGAPVANRPHPDIEPLIGFFVNTLVLRATLGDQMSFRELLAQVRETCLQAYENQDAPLEHIVEALRVERNPGVHPLIQAMFILQQPALPEADWGGVRAQIEDIASESARMDLALEITERDGALDCVFTYSADLFLPATIARMAAHFAALLATVADDPDQRLGRIMLLEAAEQNLLLGEWAGRGAAHLHALIEGQAGRMPGVLAVAGPGGQLTYADLNTRANRLARHLRSLGIGAGAAHPAVVAIFIEGSADFVVALLAVLKAGAAYAPMDIQAPAQRLSFMLADTAAPAVLTTAARMGDLPDYAGHVICLDRDWPQIAAHGGDNLGLAVSPAAPAYVIYTSGSTGQPKGVVVPHGAIANFILATAERYRLGGDDRILALPPPSFDAVGEALFPALTGGAAVVFPPPTGLVALDALIAFCRQFAVTAIVTATAVWNQWCADAARAGRSQPADFRDVAELPIRLLILGGESPPVANVRTWLSQANHSDGPLLIANRYGPTEATICVTEYSVGSVAQLPAEQIRLPIGRPLANVEVYLLDRHWQPVPIGVPGELYVGGAGLADGYLNQPALTAERFVPHPFIQNGPEGRVPAGRVPAGGRLYRTGDRARFLPDGSLEFLGRSDGQLKIRGFRIEPGEIEAALRRHPAIADACVLAVRRTPAAAARLAACLVASAALPSAAHLRAWLRQSLPAYMIPSDFVAVGGLPLTRHGKVDRGALRASLPPFDESAGLAGESPDDCLAAQPRTAIEATLAEIWAEVLGLSGIGIHESFFDRGGHSLLAPALISRVREAFPVEIPLARLFEAATVAEFATLVVAALNGQPLEPAALDLRAEAALDPAIRPPSAGAAVPPLRTALLTGATGFLGAYLLDALLRRTGADIYCLVRAATPELARERLAANLARYGLTPPDLARRVIALPGDLSRPLLGLSAEQFQHLSLRVDWIYHNGGEVNFLYPYSRLKAANVEGSREVLRLACANRAKPLHFVSSLAVFEPERYTSSVIRESDPPDSAEGIHYGYEQSKWVADRMARTARERGLPVTIYRPARITGDSRTGRANLDDFLCRLIKGCIQLGMAPDTMDVADLMPVDYLSAAMIDLSLRTDAAGQVYHFLARPVLAFQALADWLRRRGYRLETVPFERWRDELTRRVNSPADGAGEANALGPLAPLFWLQPFDGKAPLFDCQATFRAVDATGQAAGPPAADELLEIYVRSMIERGFLPPPEPSR